MCSSDLPTPMHGAPPALLQAAPTSPISAAVGHLKVEVATAKWMLEQSVQVYVLHDGVSEWFDATIKALPHGDAGYKVEVVDLANVQFLENVPETGIREREP